MKQHIYALVAKLVMITLVLYIVLGVIFGASFSTVFVMSLVLTVLAYLLGDLLILPIAANVATGTMTGNIVATLADFCLALLFIWVMGRYFVAPHFPWFTAAVISAIVIALGEMFFHRYLGGRVVEDKGPI